MTRDELLREALHERSLTLKKQARMRRAGGANIRGTVHDPSLTIERVRRYNRRQLESYIRRQREFRSQRGNYHSLQNDEILTPLEAARFKSAMRQAQQAIDARKSYIINERPMGNETVGEWMRIRGYGSGARYDGNSIFRPVYNVERKVEHSASREGAKLSEERLRSLPLEMADGRYDNRLSEQARALAQAAGVPINLTPFQAAVAWEYSPLADILKLIYETLPEGRRPNPRIHGQAVSDYEKIHSWAQGLKGYPGG